MAMLGSPEHCRFGGVSHLSTAVMPPLTYNAIPALLLPSTLFFPSSSLSLSLFLSTTINPSSLSSFLSTNSNYLLLRLWFIC